MGWGPDAPSPSKLTGQAQKQMADLAVHQQDWYETNLAPRVLDQMDQQIDISQQIADQQLGLTAKYDQRYWDTTAKYQDQFYGLVDQYSATDEQSRQAGLARADIQQAAQAGEQQQLRSMSRMGINPGSNAYMMARSKAGTDTALASAGASTMARQAAKELGMRYVGAAAGMNEGLIGASQNAAGGALSAGAAGLNAVGAAGNIQNANTNTVGGLWNNVGQLGASLYGTQMQGYGNQMEMFGTLAGAGLSWGLPKLSDRRLKTNIKRLGTRQDGLGVYAFNYVWGGQRHVGLMADEVVNVYPDAVVEMGGYMMVDYSKVGG